MVDILKDYYDALERLKLGKTLKVPKGTKVNRDSVSLEAGRKKGTIKKSRPIFKELVEAIEIAAIVNDKPSNQMQEQLDRTKAEATRYRILWEEALARELSLFKELWDVRQEWLSEREAIAEGKVSKIKKTTR